MTKDTDRYLPAGTPCQWCGQPLTTLKERNESVCEACFTALDQRHQERERATHGEVTQRITRVYHHDVMTRACEEGDHGTIRRHLEFTFTGKCSGIVRNAVGHAWACPCECHKVVAA